MGRGVWLCMPSDGENGENGKIVAELYCSMFARSITKLEEGIKIATNNSSSGYIGCNSTFSKSKVNCGIYINDIVIDVQFISFKILKSVWNEIIGGDICIDRHGNIKTINTINDNDTFDYSNLKACLVIGD